VYFIGISIDEIDFKYFITGNGYFIRSFEDFTSTPLDVQPELGLIL